jgi:hypothetical protein
LPLRGDISCESASWKSEQEPKEDERLFTGFKPNEAANMLKKDLEDAGIEYVDAAGRYTHIRLYDERTAIDSLPALPGPDGSNIGKNKAVALKTGTDDLPVKADKIAYKPTYKKLTKNAGFGCNRSSSVGIEQDRKQESAKSYKSLESVVLGSKSNQFTTADARKSNRRRPDSNRRITVLQTVALGLLATPPASGWR